MKLGRELEIEQFVAPTRSEVVRSFFEVDQIRPFLFHFIPLAAGALQELCGRPFWKTQFTINLIEEDYFSVLVERSITEPRIQNGDQLLIRERSLWLRDRFL
ncbi:MAG TPA: hypothetical protein VF883_11805 [Thermoanaerobaculia bacterium]